MTLNLIHSLPLTRHRSKAVPNILTDSGLTQVFANCKSSLSSACVCLGVCDCVCLCVCVHTHKSLSASQTKVQPHSELEHQEPHNLSAVSVVTFVTKRKVHKHCKETTHRYLLILKHT